MPDETEQIVKQMMADALMPHLRFKVTRGDGASFSIFFKTTRDLREFSRFLAEVEDVVFENVMKRLKKHEL